MEMELGPRTVSKRQVQSGAAFSIKEDGLIIVHSTYTLLYLEIPSAAMECL
jgi:hypothetical protein